MPIPILEEPNDLGPPYEDCSLCGVDTKYWTNIKGRKSGEQVPCCKICAERCSPRDVPSIEQWMNEEEDKVRHSRAKNLIRKSHLVYRNPAPIIDDHVQVTPRTKQRPDKKNKENGRSNGAHNRGPRPPRS